MGHYLSTAATPATNRRSRYGKASPDVAVVLIVENEALIRMNAVQMVEDAGYSALEASSADDAIEILDRRRDVGAVFTDIIMSGSRSGLKLAHAIRLRWPPVHLIVTSGLPAELEMPSGAHFIRKPYENARVIALLHKFFDSDQTPECEKHYMLHRSRP
jgi:two-component system, response regulator PdtaR